jgi:hypothetical protein
VKVRWAGDDLVGILEPSDGFDYLGQSETYQGEPWFLLGKQKVYMPPPAR